MRFSARKKEENLFKCGWRGRQHQGPLGLHMVLLSSSESESWGREPLCVYSHIFFPPKLPRKKKRSHLLNQTKTSHESNALSYNFLPPPVELAPQLAFQTGLSNWPPNLATQFMPSDGKGPSSPKRPPERERFSETTVATTTVDTPTSAKHAGSRIGAVVNEAKRLFRNGPATSVVSAESMNELRGLLSKITLADVRATTGKDLKPGEVGYVSIEDHENFQIGVFVLSPGASIPLHNHPEMCVLSQVVNGAVHVVSFDAAKDGSAFLVDDCVCAAPTSRILFPKQGGNFHSFKSSEGCVIMDVMSPPYDEDEGRECTYFQALPNNNGASAYKLVPHETDFVVVDLTATAAS